MILNRVEIHDKFSLETYFNITELERQLPGILDELSSFYEKEDDAICFMEMIKEWSDMQNVDNGFRNKLAEVVKTHEREKKSPIYGGAERKLEGKVAAEQILDRGRYTSWELFNLLVDVLDYQTNQSQRVVVFKDFIQKNLKDIKCLMNCLEKDTEEAVLFSCLFLYGLISYDEIIEYDDIMKLIMKNRTKINESKGVIEITTDKVLPWYNGEPDSNLILRTVCIKNVGSHICNVTIEGTCVVDCMAVSPNDTIYAMGANDGYIFFFRKTFGSGENLCHISGNIIENRNKKISLPFSPISCARLDAFGMLYLTPEGNMDQQDKIHYMQFPSQSGIVSFDIRENEYCLLRQDGSTYSNSKALIKTDVIRVQPGVGNMAFIKSDYSVTFEYGEAPDGTYTCMAVISFLNRTRWVGISTDGELKASFDIQDKIPSGHAIYVRTDGFQFVITYKDNREIFVE